MSQVRIIVSDGKVSAFVDGGTWEDAQEVLEVIKTEFADLEIVFEEGEPKVERHIHGPDGAHVRDKRSEVQ